MRFTVPAVYTLVTGTILVGLWQHQPPAPPAQAIDQQFSVERAIAHVERIARRPHTTGSPEGEEVRAYLAGELRQSSLDTTEQVETTLGRDGPGRYAWGTSRNVLGRLRGRGGNGKAVLLVAHYDTVPSSPGASDNGSSVAALLESARVLQRGPALRNDVIVLFTDGEETGPSGAEAFVARHPWAHDVGVVLNFDARGTAGPSLMFETSQGNGWLIRQLAQSASHPRASSLYDEIYRWMPNDTDLTVFKRQGLPGLNFAFIERPGRYHSSGDTAAWIDRATLSHHGSQALSVARSLADTDLPPPSSPDAVYFTVANHLVAYSPTWRWTVAVLGTLLLVGLLWRARASDLLTWRALAWALSGHLVALLLSGAVGYGVWRLLWGTVPAFTTPGLMLYVNAAYGITVVLLCVALAFATLALLRRRTTRQAALWSGAILGGVAVWIVTMAVPGASYVLVWPWLVTLVGLVVLLRFGTRAFWTEPLHGDSRPSALDAMGSVLMAVPAGLLIAPVIWVLFAAFGMRAALPVAVLASLALLLIMPVLLIASGGFAGRSTVGAAAVAAVALAVGVASTGPSAIWPKRAHVFYAHSLDDGTALWGSRAETVDEWTSQVLGRTPQRGAPAGCFADTGRVIYRAAPVVAPAPPTHVTVARDRIDGATRLIDLRVQSTPGTWWSLVNRSAATSSVALVDVGGLPVDARHGDERFRAVSVGSAPGDAVLVRLRTTPTAALRLVLYDSTDVLPERVTPRPAWIVRGVEGRMFSDVSTSCRTLTVDAVTTASR